MGHFVGKALKSHQAWQAGTHRHAKKPEEWGLQKCVRGTWNSPKQCKQHGHVTHPCVDVVFAKICGEKLGLVVFCVGLFVWNQCQTHRGKLIIDSSRTGAF